ncbi:MAG: thioredoxin [Clostridia bacterium]|nr:thioredoxin [Clostridia bacterium]
MAIINITSVEEFKQELDCEKPVLVDFWATWCNPCKMLAPVIHEFAEEIGDKVKVLKVDVDEVMSLCYEYSVASIPTVMVFKNGQMVERQVGLTTKAGLSDLVIKHL